MKYAEKTTPVVQSYAVFACNHDDFNTYEHQDCRIVLGVYDAVSAEAAAEGYHEMFGDYDCKHFAVVLSSEVRWFNPVTTASKEKDGPDA